MNHRILHPAPILPNQLNQATSKVNRSQLEVHSGQGKSFNSILSDQLSNNTSIKFSNHAQQRLDSRNISISREDLKRLEKGIDRAAQKGSRDSLILMDQMALIVSVKNRTVITAVDDANLKENVFTNIDSAVIV